MERLEEEVAPHAQGVDVALAAFGVDKGSAKMHSAEVRKIEINKNGLARAMVAQAEQAFLAIAQRNALEKAIVTILEYNEMEPFFV